MFEYKEFITTIGDLKPDDLVFGTDGKWHKIKLLKIHEPIKMYKINFSNGSVKCSGDHEWTLLKDKISITTDTENLYNNIESFKGFNVGLYSGPIILNIEKIESIPSRCIIVDSEDHQFEILTDSNKRIFTHNCQMRFVCGRLGSTASMMALGNTLATTIDGKHPGAGAIAANGSIDMIQFYFAEHSWLEEWFKKRGLDKLGHDPNEIKKETILEDLSGEEDIEIESETMNIDFAGVHGEIDKTKDQKFEEI